MKVVSSQQMSSIESQAYQDGSSESDFMEEAGSGIALVVHEYAELHNIDRNVIIVCGPGNNGGDGYVAGQHLVHLEYQVTALQLAPLGACSALCQQHHLRFFQEGGRIIEIQSANDFVFPSSGIIVDAIYGTGFHGNLREPIASIVDQINKSNLPVIAIDIPSGLDGNTGNVYGKAIVATETAFLGLPKIGFFLRDGWDHVGKLRYIDFGLPKNYIASALSQFQMLTTEEVKFHLPKIKRSRHKYEAGYVVGLAGSPGMAGAALLSSDAALHSGAGIVRLLYPKGMEAEFGSSNIEILKMAFEFTDVQEIAKTMNKASANLIGPGIGRKPETLRLLQHLLPLLKNPSVIDADALFWLAESDLPLPEHSILTPHRGEMDRLLKLEQHQPLDEVYLQLCMDYAEKKGCTVVLKGGPTFVIHPGAPVQINPRGDPGMATAGSGDLLTGLLAGLLAQKMTPVNAAALGVYIHGIAGEFAANEMTSYCMTASDILYHFPEGFLLFDSIT